VHRAFLTALQIAATLAWLAWGTLTAFFPQAAPERDAVAVLRTWGFLLAICTTASAAVLGKRGGGE